MTKRSISQKQRSWLAGELNDWQSRGLLSADQAAPILDLYESQAELADRQRNKTLLTLMGIAALLVGLGVLLLVGYNWELMPDALKLLIIFGVTFGTHAAGFHLRFQRQSKLLSEVVIFLGCLFYGIGIHLVAQIFHLNVHYPAGLWWWALGVVPFAFLMDTPLLHALLATLLAIWCGMEIFDFHDAGLWFFGRWKSIPNGAYSLPIIALPGLVWGYRRGSLVTVTMYVMLLTWWMVLQPYAWEMWHEAFYLICALGGLMLIIAECHPSGSRYAIPYRLLGVLLAGYVLIAMSFYGFNKGLANFESKSSVLGVALLIAILLSATIYIAALLRRAGDPESLSLKEAVHQIVRTQYLLISLVVAMIALCLWQSAVGDLLIPTIVANAAMILLAFWLMNVGLREDRGRPFGAGVLFFLLWAVLRYIDLFGDFGGMLGGAMMFFFCGAALFGVAWYWRKRKKVQHDE